MRVGIGSIGLVLERADEPVIPHPTGGTALSSLAADRRISAREILVVEKGITTLAIGLVLTAVGSSAGERAAV